MREVDVAAGRISLSMLTKEQEEKSRPAPRERNNGEGGGNKGGRDSANAVSGSWKNTGAADWKESMDTFKEGQPVFENEGVIMQRRK